MWSLFGLLMILPFSQGLGDSQKHLIGEWPVYGADKAGTKYSPLTQINRENFSSLEIAWRWKSVDAFLSKRTKNNGEWWSSKGEVIKRLEQDNPGLYRTKNSPNYSNLQATPLMVDGRLFLNTPLSQGAALDVRGHRPCRTLRSSLSPACRPACRCPPCPHHSL